jgi:hypothetical protein
VGGGVGLEAAWCGLVWGRPVLCRLYHLHSHHVSTWYRKHWSIAKEDTEEDGIELEESDKSGKVLSCVQERGDLVYVPEGRQHAVKNEGEVVAVSALINEAMEPPEPPGSQSSSTDGGGPDHALGEEQGQEDEGDDENRGGEHQENSEGGARDEPDDHDSQDRDGL